MLFRTRTSLSFPLVLYALADELETLGRPLGRVGYPDDVASLVLFLAGDGSQWITGQNFPVDGGITIKGGWAPLHP